MTAPWNCSKMIRTGWQDGMYQAYRLEIVRREKEMAETGKRQAVAASTGHGRDANSIKKRILIYEKNSKPG